MIARHWRGWTTRANSDAYEKLLKEKVLPGLGSIPGYKGGYVLRKVTADDEVEFVVLNLFDSIESVQAFAGSEYSAAKFEPEARDLLSKVEPVAIHYEVRVNT